MTDLKELTEILVKKGKVRGKPVGISLFRESIPEGYKPIQEEPCAIVRHAMDREKKVYFDADHHDCLVGMHHSGIIPGKREILSGEYLSKPFNFMTYEGCARLKSGEPVLPQGLVKAIGAAPLDAVPRGTQVDWIVAVCNPHNANFIAGCRLCHDGIPPDGSFGTSLCVSLFAIPWHKKNCLVVSGDFGGRLHNRIKQDQLFVVIPIEYADYLPRVLLDVKVDIKMSRRMTKPAHSKFWEKEQKPADTGADTDARAEPKVKAVEAPSDIETGDDEQVDISSITFTMPWDDEAKGLLDKVPVEILEMVVNNSEEYAREHGYEAVCRKSMEEQMAALGMDLDEMLDMV